MPVEAKDGLRFILTSSNDLDDPFESQTEWPRLSCPQANQLALEFGELKIDKSLTVKDAIATQQLSVTGSLTVDNDLTVGNAIATQQLSVSETVTGSLSVENNLTVGGSLSTSEVNARGRLSSQNGIVKRDFVTWTTTEEGSNPIHIKTNIFKTSNTMYRILVEGYNYRGFSVINSDVVGYAWSGEESIIQAETNNYANGATISQYYSSDGYVVIKLTIRSTYYSGFSASAWFTNPAGKGFDISAQEVIQQAEDL